MALQQPLRAAQGTDGKRHRRYRTPSADARSPGPDPVARMYRVPGLYPGPESDLWAAAAGTALDSYITVM
ncbi:hypothetical protein GCM10027570_00230 [Streptomonospora sediminis]